MKTIIFTHQAARDLDTLASADRIAVSAALDLFALRGLGDIKRLKDRAGFRLRVGAYRVLFTQDDDTVVVVFIGRRTTTTYS